VNAPLDETRMQRTTAMEAGRLAAALQAQVAGDIRPLELLCRETLEIHPTDRVAHATLCHLLTARNEYSEARDILERALDEDPDDPYLHLNLSHCYMGLRQYRLSQRHARRASELNPKELRNWINLSSACYHLDDLDEGVEAAEKALAISPGDSMALTNLGTIRKAQGRVKQATALFQRALEADPNNLTSYTNLLLVMLYDENVTVQQVFDVARGFALRHESPLVPRWPVHDNLPLPERRLKIGFLSPDFTSHAVMYFAEPVLTRLPRQHFEICCYFTLAAGDVVTERIKLLADRFRHVPQKDPAQTARIIQSDGIDILIDLAGHTAKTGLPAMAYHPAPVQVTWLGYPGTTGLRSIQWRITDHTADQQGADPLYSEKLVRLPGCFAVYRPHVRHPLHHFDPEYQVAPPPVLRNGFITFGSCNNIAKIGERAVQVWSRILQQVPGSKMLVEGKDFSNPGATLQLRNQFERHGIESNRLIFVQRDTRRQYLAYHDIDIALDTFPLTGGTTTFDCLWMGVPIVSLVGRNFRERLSTTILYHGGFQEFLCANVDEYMERAVGLASDVGALADRRSGQRARMQASVLMDEPRFVRLFGQALRMIWRAWCKEHGAHAQARAEQESHETALFVRSGAHRLPLAQVRSELKRWLEEGSTPATPDKRISDLALAVLEVMPECDLAARVIRNATVDNGALDITPPLLAT
jgi:protein O-GlcNAc transferase